MLPGVFSNTTKEDKLFEMPRLTALRLEVGHCKANGQAYPDAWNTLLSERNKTPLMARSDQKQAFYAGERFLHPEPLYLKDGTKVEIPMYFKKPEAQIYLPGLLAKGRRWGLNVNRIANWWIDFKKSAQYYRALSQDNNCVGVALQGLVEGGAGVFIKPPAIRVYGEPVRLEKYALELEHRFFELESMATGLENGIRSDHLAQKPPYHFELNDGIWRQEVWKRESALGFIHTRSALIADIDRSVAAFDRLTWKDNFADRFDALLHIFLGVVRHRHEKSDSKRAEAEAVAQLGKQVLAILDQRGFCGGFKPVWN